MTEPTLPFMDAVLVCEVPPPVCEHPFFLVGWHGMAAGWAIHKQMWISSDCDGIKRQIDLLEQKGWAHIKVMRLPL